MDERFVFIASLGIPSTVTRVKSIDNDVADGLSRGGGALADALRTAMAAGLPLRRVHVTEAVRCTQTLF